MMKCERTTQEHVALVSRRNALGVGIATGVLFAIDPAKDAVAKSPFESDLSPESKAAFDFAIAQNWKSGPGFYAVAYTEDNFGGDPLLVGTPAFMQKPQTGTMPDGWGSKAGSIVVGAGAVLRLFHKVDGRKVDGRESHTTLLPGESLAQVNPLGIGAGACSWKLYPAGDLRPPY
jgi:hypothetical protein